MLVKVNRIGGYSKSTVIPKSLIRELGWSWGDRLLFERAGDTIIVSKINRPSKDTRKLRFIGYSYAVTISRVIAKDLDSDWLVVEAIGGKLILRMM